MSQATSGQYPLLALHAFHFPKHSDRSTIAITERVERGWKRTPDDRFDARIAHQYGAVVKVERDRAALAGHDGLKEIFEIAQLHDTQDYAQEFAGRTDNLACDRKDPLSRSRAAPRFADKRKQIGVRSEYFGFVQIGIVG